MKEGPIHPSLIKDCLANQRAAQRELYDHCLPYLSLIAKRYLRGEAGLKDILQDSFLQIFSKLHQYDSAKASFKTWSTRIVINNCLKRNERQVRLAEEVFSPEEHTSAIAPEALRKLNEQELLDWLRNMPRDLHTVFLLHVVDGFSHQEIASMLNISAASSRQRLSRARKWLARQLQEERGKDRIRRLSFVPLLLTIYVFVDQIS